MSIELPDDEERIPLVPEPEMAEFRNDIAEIKEGYIERARASSFTEGFLLDRCNPQDLDAEDYITYNKLGNKVLTKDEIADLKGRAVLSGNSSKESFMDWVAHAYTVENF